MPRQYEPSKDKLLGSWAANVDARESAVILETFPDLVNVRDEWGWTPLINASVMNG